ncbi:TPA: Asp-tRNA(Asn)/Glu-tRNA(Gln) amidotransferase GatCAB subunit A [Candidatus Veblenbacteria bacterium]|nr:Asp-tRNA(Asn)/Glu-tRNA(Gln) amidotransferase GatCAB subunit A [Candidatus Veblenbacteria bacterium]
MLGIQQLTEKIKARELSAVEVVEKFNKTIAASKLNSFITPTPQQALAQARQIDEAITKGEKVGSLAGVPVAIKDVIVTKGIRSTGGSKILDNYLPPYDATVVERLKQAGAIIVGKTNCDEFAMGSSGENSGYEPSNNPWDKTKVTGGSSSGSTAAVAAVECVAALGSETGGSVRQPASFCGVVGLKPTYGRVSRHGLMAMTSSLDQVGPLARTVTDTARILQVIAGQDERDATSSRQSVPDYLANLPKDIKGMRIGVAAEFFADGLQAEVKELVEKAIAKIKSLAATIVEVSLPSLEYALAAYYVICPSEVSANLARYDGIRYGGRAGVESLADLYTKTRGQLLGAEAKRRIMLGTYVLSAGYYEAYYHQALLVRQVIKKDFDKIFNKVDILATPTTPTTAFALGSKLADPLSMYLADVYTVPVNIAGLPAISLPCGLAGGLPVGLQLIGPAWSEDKLLQVAYQYEQSERWREQLPPGVKSVY